MNQTPAPLPLGMGGGIAAPSSEPGVAKPAVTDYHRTRPVIPG